MSRKNSFLIVYPVLCGLWYECIFSLFLEQGFAIHKFTYSVLAGLFLYWIGQLTHDRRRALRMQTLFVLLVCGIYCVQVCYYTLFGVPLFLNSLTVAGDAMGDFYLVALHTIVEAGPVVLLMLAYLLLWFTVYRPRFLAVPYSEKRGWRALMVFTVWLCTSVCAAVLDYTGATSASYMMLYEFVPTESVRKLGMLSTVFLDIKYNVFGLQTTHQETVRLDMENIEVETLTEDASDPETMAAADDEAQREGAVAPTPADLAPLEKGSYEKLAVDTTSYSPDEYNVMEIDFTKELQKDEELRDEDFADMNAYFSSQKPTKKNAHTGIFAGKNLILITAEAFSRFLIDEERTPTLYKLATEGFRFEHFYTPIWGGSTSDGEFVATTGLIPKAGVWSYTEVADNYMPFAFGNQFRALGYLTDAFHDHSYTYYNRNLSYPNMGYDFYAQGQGLHLTETWPESDVEMIEQSTPLYAVSGQPFHAYYMTVSGHLQYTWDSNAMSLKNRSRVADVDACEEVQAYLACQLELEDAMSALLDDLEAAGVLEDTVIALSGDHYPYGLTTEQYRQLRGEDFDETFGLYENTFLLWTPGLSGPLTVDSYCSSLDIAPTLSNLFGLTYDSRLYMGTDIFSDTPPLVCFQDRSFITQQFMYDNTNEKIYRTGDENVSEENLADYIAAVKNRFYYSAKIIDTDYYGYLFDKSSETDAG